MSALPKGWVEASVEEIVAHDGNSIADGPYGSKLKSSHYTGQGARVIRLGNIGRRQYLSSSEAFISMEYFEELRSHEVIKGDIVMAALGDPIGRCCEVPTEMLPAIVKADCFRIRLGAAVAPKFFLYLMNSAVIATRLAEEAHGVGRLRINLSDLRQLRLPLPPLAEQERIVAKLDALNAKSTRARTELARIETLVARYKQAVLGKAFSGELTREWRRLSEQMAPVRARQAQQVKSSYQLAPDQPFEAPYDLPSSWDWFTLPYLGDLDRGKSRHRPRNDPRLYDGPFPFIQTGDVRAANQYVREHSQTYSAFGLAQSRLWPEDTLCITIAANIAETALLSYPACFPDSVVGFSADLGKLHPKYAEFFLRTAKERISQFAPATAQKNINLEILAAVRLPVAPIEEQHEIVRRIETAFARIDRLAAEAKRALALLGKLDEAVLAKAFRGELVPQDETDEPAAKLLARIRTERATAPKVKRGRRANA